MVNAGANDNAETCPTFEQCLDELARIVNDLEGGSLGLEDSLRRFEKGISLLRSCYQTLEQAERKIEILTGLDATGQPVTVAFDATATIELPKKGAGKRASKKKEAAPEPPPDEDDEGSTLF